MALTRDRIVEEAVALADEDGLDALTMRSLGRRLGVEAMSLYRHVGNKDELLAAIHEHLLATLPPPPSDGWETILVHQAGAFRALLAAHPALVPLFASRAAETPRAVVRVDAILAALQRGGFDEEQAVSAFQLVFEYVLGHAAFHLAGGVDDPVGQRRFAFGLDALRAGLRAATEGRLTSARSGTAS